MNSPISKRIPYAGENNFSNPPKNQLEGCMYRRRSDISTIHTKKSINNDWNYHNHILQGCYLRYIRQPISPKEAASYRLILVSGKAKGRLEEIMLHSSSEVTTGKLSESDAPSGSCYIINVSGKSHNGSEQRWQLALSSLNIQMEWVEAINYAKKYTHYLSETGELEKLKTLARKMINEIDIRSRIRGFKIHRGVFMGSDAVKWIASEIGCSSSQSVIVGNQMLNSDIFHHVAREHMFCDSKLYYRFSDSVVNDIDHGLLNRDSETQNYDKLQSLMQEPSSYEIEFLKSKFVQITEKLNENSLHVKNLHIKTMFLESILGHNIITIIILFTIIYLQTKVSHIVLAVSSVLSLVWIFLSYFYCYHSSQGGRFDPIMIETELEKKMPGDDEEEIIDANIAESIFEDDYSTDLELMLQEEENEDDENENEETNRIDNTDRERLSSFDINTFTTNSIRAPSVTVDVPPVSEWPNSPILVRRSPAMLPSSMCENSSDVTEMLGPLKLHDEEYSEIPIESDFFIGKIVIIFRDIPNAPAEYFKSQKRKFRAILQGRFKKALSFSSAYTGQVFDEPVNTLPAKWLTKTVLHLISKIQPRFAVSIKGDKPYFLSPLVSAAQSIVISRVGNEPKFNIVQPLEEDLSLLGKKYAGMSVKRRKAHFSRCSNLRKHFFDPNLVYTFDFYQHIINFANFEANIGVVKYDLIKFLGSNPLQLMAVAWDPYGGVASDNFDDDKLLNTSRRPPPKSWPYIFNLEILHEKSYKYTEISKSPASPTKFSLWNSISRQKS